MRTPIALGTVVTAVTIVVALPDGAPAEAAGRAKPSAELGTAYHLIHQQDIDDPQMLEELRQRRIVICNTSMDVDELHEKLPDTLAFAGLTFMLVPDFGHGNPFWDGWQATLKESDYYHDAQGNRIKSVWNAYWIRTTPDYARRISRYFAENCKEWDGLYIDMYRLEWAPWHISYLQEHGAVEPIDQNLHKEAQKKFGRKMRRLIGDQLMIVNTSGYPGDYVNGITMEYPSQRFGRDYSLQQYRKALNANTYYGRQCVNVSWYEDMEVSRLVMPGNVNTDLGD